MSAAKERVLLVDDEPQVLVALEDLLSDEFVIMKSESPEHALALADQHPDIAVVVSDQRMPRMTGDELLARLGASLEARRILVTGFADLSAVIRAVNDGKIFAYVTKPWDRTDLRLKVQQAAEHFRLAKELAQERRLLNSILHSMNDGIVVADCAGNLLLFNARAEEILGRRPLDVEPATWAGEYGVYSPPGKELLGPAQNPLLRAMAGERVPHTEAFVRNERARKTIAITGTPLTGNAHEVSGGVAVFRDITEQRELEVQLGQAQKMEAIGRLAGGVAHDFNNLLVVIQSYSELVREDLPAGDPKRADIDEILASTRRAAALTKQLLAFSRKETVQPKPVSLNDAVAGIEKMLQRIIGEDIVLVSDLEPSLGLVCADTGQLDQIILNLSINARDAMPEGGQLSIETQNVTLEADFLDTSAVFNPGEYAVLAITDTGTGMDRETQSHIFEPFFTTKEVGKGTGLGLSTVYGIVQQSGGHIRVYSEVGRGTSFKIYFPRLKGSASALTSSEEIASQPHRGGTVLLVEDDASVRQVASRILRSRGYTVLEARQPSEARALCAEHGNRVDLVLTDVIMPECTGPQLARELTLAYPDLRVLYMSGYPGGAAKRAGSLDPDVPYIEKPFSPALLLEVVRKTLAGE